ncbi:glycoside hydrolase family 3 C-terminal domain-containing protein [Maribacter polysiphoniae]|uniref:Beta-glucosidase n=1 Tax=Maribacter polysiphoniae TaxID=429344 RepID=A0A316E8N2_9FLAO|nr:glycoside hydrolase family 3 C-terminal domain-containing protein [Maribacter polysiphoniae]MBD1260428.1 glycoside hydrolase family 3 C-terminal domain-containing protein [Maribacter polysiphoniae]PWK25892.1 beta-glucosidase [Maribacter polysiphoniae]
MSTKHAFLLFLAATLSITSCTNGMKTTKVETTIKTKFQGKEISLDNEKKIDSLIALMTLEEKIGMLHGQSMFANGGVERLGIPKLHMTDGPLGIREEISQDSWAPAGWDNDFATYYPAAGSVAATWNPELSYKFGNSVGQEARARNKDMLLSPAINIIRTPLGGRTYEYFTEDPFLNKKLAVPFIVGIQDNDVMACVKHFAVNNQETNRDFVDVNTDERTLREIYLPAFKASVTEANAYSVMGAYNKFRGDFLCENDYMQNKILRDEWGFRGIVVSDWSAVHSTVKTLENGLDIEMGTRKPFNEYFLADKLIAAAKAGEISKEEIDKHVRRILRVLFQVKAIDSTDRTKGSLATEEHYKDAYDIAAESIVLLKNDNNLLPLRLDDVHSIAVIGNNATKKNALGGFGAGVKTKREVTPLDGLKNKLPENIKINYAEGYLERYTQNDNNQKEELTLNTPRTVTELDPDKLNEALEAAKKSDMAIIFAGSNRDYETEASDRKDLSLPFGQEELIEKVLEVNPNTLVVMIAGAPFDINMIKEKSSTLIWSWFNGSEGGNALADVILGNVNPSGKLPWTMPKKIEDSPAHATHSFPGNESVTYEEGILVGYRWFDTKKVEPLYPFGFGLSYTDFEFSDISTSKDSYTEDEEIQINFTIKNIGDRDGKEVAQLYVSHSESAVEKAAKELKGFKKVFVKSGESQNIAINIPVKELAYYQEASKNWVVEKGTYILKIGNSSRNILQEVSIKIN